MYRHIIWDVDGTLFDTYPAIAGAFKSALSDLGQDAPLGWIKELAQQSLGYCVSTLADRYSLTEEDVERGFDKHYSDTRPEEQPPFPGVIAVCRYICSSGGQNVIVTHRGREGTAELLAANDMAHYFASCLTRDDGYPKKPDPAAFEAILKRCNLTRGETLAVGDRDIDVLAGRAAGLFTCLFGATAEGAAADLTISHFDELHRYLIQTNPYCEVNDD
jgi:phosphoglycolate phosphatase-like HAD superfamily hydrolase